MAAPVLQSTAETTISTANPLTATLPAGITGGELLVAHVTIAYSLTNITNAQGWNRALFGSDNAGEVSYAVFWKLADGSEANPSFTMTSGNTQKNTVTAIQRISGVDSTTPIDALGTNVQSATGSSMNLPSVTTVTPDALLLGFSSNTSDNGGTVTTSFPVSMTKYYDQSTTTNLDRGGAAAYEARPTIGATGTRQASFSPTGRVWSVGGMLAVRPGGIDSSIGWLMS